MSERPRILLVDDEIENLKALERTLRREFEPFGLNDPAIALEKLRQEEFAVIVSDHQMPGMSGTELLETAARERPHVTRILLTAYTETPLMLDAINRARIYRYVTKPWDNDEFLTVVRQAVEHHRLKRENAELLRTLEQRNRELEQKERELLGLNEQLESLVEKRTQELREVNQRLSELAMTDPLTRVMNRRAFFSRFRDEIERSRRYSHPLAVVMVDVDHFKAFNDMEGHVFGDEALKKIAAIFSRNLRKTDVLARYGGGEFILLMPETRVPDAVEICERLRQAIETTEFQGKDQGAYLTVSIGVAGYPGQGESAEELVQAADQALYEAKHFGRNRVVGP